MSPQKRNHMRDVSGREMVGGEIQSTLSYHATLINWLISAYHPWW